MSKYIITGQTTLHGEIRISGNKNAILPIMAATLLVSGDTYLANVPQIKDVAVMGDILRNLGATVETISDHQLRINTDSVCCWKVDRELTKRLRASVLLLGPLLSRFGRAELVHPGGDIIGKRSIDTHLLAFKHLGVAVRVSDDYYTLKATDVSGDTRRVFLSDQSVTGTENVLMACIHNKGETVVENAAMEPHVEDLIDFLIAAGADIEGKGANRLFIRHSPRLTAVRHSIVPDHIEVGTFAICAAVAKSKIAIYPAIEKHLIMTMRVLASMGVAYEFVNDRLIIRPSKLMSSASKIQAGPWPAFPTDLMSPLIVLATQAKGETLFHDPMYESRMFFVDKLIRMGAQITICDPHRVIVYGPTKLSGNVLNSPDIRAGMALVIAGLIAKGESVIDHAEIIERGYEDLETRLTTLGGRMTKI